MKEEDRNRLAVVGLIVIAFLLFYGVCIVIVMATGAGGNATTEAEFQHAVREGRVTLIQLGLAILAIVGWLVYLFTKQGK